VIYFYHLPDKTQVRWLRKRTESHDQVSFWKFIPESLFTNPEYEQK